MTNIYLDPCEPEKGDICRIVESGVSREEKCRLISVMTSEDKDEI